MRYDLSYTCYCHSELDGGVHSQMPPDRPEPQFLNLVSSDFDQISSKPCFFSLQRVADQSDDQVIPLIKMVDRHSPASLARRAARTCEISLIHWMHVENATCFTISRRDTYNEYS